MACNTSQPLSKQPAFRYTGYPGYPAREMTSGEVPQKFLTDEASCHYPDLVNASDWLKQIFLAARPIRSTTQIRIVTRHQQRIYVLVPQT